MGLIKWFAEKLGNTPMNVAAGFDQRRLLSELSHDGDPDTGKSDLKCDLKNASIYRLIAKVAIQDVAICSGARLLLNSDSLRLSRLNRYQAHLDRQIPELPSQLRRVHLRWRIRRERGGPTFYLSHSPKQRSRKGALDGMSVK